MRLGVSEAEAMAWVGVAEETVDMAVWPDNLGALDVFLALATQWRVGMAGATGLIYEALPVVLRLTGASRKDWPGLFRDVQTMERAVLDEIRK